MNRYLDNASFAVALITLVLFSASLVTKGLTHDLFLESGVFLVSVKIIAMAYRNSLALGQLNEKLDAVLAACAKINDQRVNTSEGSNDRPNADGKTGA